MNPEDKFKLTDFTISIGDKEIEKIQYIDTSSSERPPVFELGDPDPRSFSKRVDTFMLKEKFGIGVLNNSAVAKVRLEASSPILNGLEYYENIILLPRGNFSLEELESLLPDPGDVFQLERLHKWNPGVFPFEKGTCSAISIVIREEGIIGMIKIKSVV